MAITLQSSQQLAAVHGVKCMVYSRSGFGKTSLCATAPNPVILSAESGLLSLSYQNLVRMYGENTPGITYNIPVIQIATLQDLIEAEQWCRQAAEAQQFQTICLDSITEIAEKVLSNAKAQVKDPRQAYGELIEKMVTTIKTFRDLPGKHVYMTAKEEKAKDEASGAMMYGPMMPGSKLGPGIPYYMDEVLNLNIHTDPATKQSYRYLRTKPDFSYDAKDRSGVLDEIEQPHLGYIFNKIVSNCGA